MLTFAGWQKCLTLHAWSEELVWNTGFTAVKNRFFGHRRYLKVMGWVGRAWASEKVCARDRDSQTLLIPYTTANVISS